MDNKGNVFWIKTRFVFQIGLTLIYYQWCKLPIKILLLRISIHSFFFMWVGVYLIIKIFLGKK